MKKRFFIVILLLFFITGCSSDYTVNINKDLSVNENILVYEDLDFIKDLGINNYDELIEFYKNTISVDSSKYSISKYKKSNFIGSNINRNYSNISEYIDSINSYNFFLNESSYTNSSGIAEFKSNLKYEENEEFVNIISKIDSKITFKVPFKVLDTNADEIDTLNNKYTWNVNNYKNNNFNIYLKFDTNVKNNLLLYSVIIFILFLVFFITFILRRKYIKNSKI